MIGKPRENVAAVRVACSIDSIHGSRTSPLIVVDRRCLRQMRRFSAVLTNCADCGSIGLRREQLQQLLGGVDQAAAVAAHVDDQPVVGQQVGEAGELVDERRRRSGR